jgi:hypothetical protein
MRLRRLIASWLFSGIPTRIRTMRSRLRRYLRKLERLMQYCRIRKSDQYLISTARRDLILVAAGHLVRTSMIWGE